jgi:hypothetical protein
MANLGTTEHAGREEMYIEVLDADGPQELVNEYSGTAFEKSGRSSPTSRSYDTIVDGSFALSPELNLGEGSSIGGTSELIELPDGKVLYGFSYKGDIERTRRRFVLFCKATGRICASPKGHALILLDETHVPLSDCKVIPYTPKRRPYRRRNASEPVLSLPREPRCELSQPVGEFARELLHRDTNMTLEVVEIYEFEGDSRDLESHDFELHESLVARFAADFHRVRDELVAEFGEPSSIGEEDDEHIPLAGVFRFDVWQQNHQWLYLAAAHEDRELPYLLVLGTSAVSDK